MDDVEELLKKSALYQEFLAEREEILRHKWIESEKAGRDVGFEKALLDWTFTHRAKWREERQRRQAAAAPPKHSNAPAPGPRAEPDRDKDAPAP